jgi:threonine dehydrogenase-like Zn-dependent dehydrogenase
VEASDNTVADVRELTGGLGVDVSMETGGYPETLRAYDVSRKRQRTPA